nr:hypothetical protein [Aeromonas hydrophila]
MRWEELDLGNAIWTIPAGRMKAHVTHRVPLSLEALAVLKKVQGLHGEWVFPSPRKPGIQIISATLMDEWREVANC